MSLSAPLTLFLPTLDDGGAERVMLQLGASFAARGHRVDLVLAVPGGPLESQVPPGIRVIDLRATRTVLALPTLVNYLRRTQPAALLSTLEHSNVLAVAASTIARTSTRVVLREANVVLPLRPGPTPIVQRFLVRRSYEAASAIIAVSESVAQSLVSRLTLPAPRIRTIYNPIVSANLSVKAQAQLEDPWFAQNSPPVVLGVGRLVPQKDFSTLVRAFALVRAVRPARLVILGEGSQRSMLEALTHELGLQHDVRFPGYDHNPFRYMQRATVFALSSIFEGLPGALIQAMACGCRVVSTDCPGGSREILRDGALGPLVPTGDPSTLALKIIELLDDARQRPARPCYDLERFSEASAVREYLEVLGVEPKRD